MNNKQKKYVILGNSAAGIAAIRTLRNLDPEGHIVCFSDEAEQPYNKCFLADYLSKSKQEKDMCTVSPEQLKTWNIDMRLGVCVTAIMSDNKTIMTDSGATESYDKLLIATGTRPFMPPIKDLERYTNVISFHNLNSALALEHYLQNNLVRHATVIGAGLSGIEVTDALISRGVKVSLIERGDQLLAAHLTKNGSQVLQQAMQKAGVHVMTHMSVKSVSGRASIASAIELSDASMLQTDLIIVTAGVRRNDELARSAGIKQSEYGIEVDEHMQTNKPDVYAAGDIIAIKNHISGRLMASCTWPDAMQQGRCAAHAMAGKPQAYAGAHVIASSAFFGMKFYSCGAVDGTDGEIIEQVGFEQYGRYLLQGEQLKAFQLLGSGGQFAQLRRAVMTGAPISQELKKQ